MVDFATIKKGFKIIGAASIDPICKIISGIGMLSMVLIVAMPILSSVQVGAMAFIVPICAYVFGYVLQWIFLAIFRYKPDDDFSYEGVATKIEWRYALIPLAISGILAMILRGVFYNHFLSLMHQGLLNQFDSYSLQPYACALAVFICAGAGIVVQFYPYGRLMSERVMITCIGISLLSSLFMGGSVVVGILFSIYAACTILLMNQSYITRSYKSIVVTKIPTSARLYNLRMILLCLVLTAIGGVFVFIIVNGLYRVILFLFYLTIYKLTANIGNNVGKTELKPVEEVVFEGGKAAQYTNKFSLLAFILITLVSLIGLILARSVPVYAIINAIKNWFEEFIAMFMGSRERIREPEINYRDEVETLDKVKASRIQAALSRTGKLSLREFNSELSALKSDTDKLSYAYLVMIRLLGELNTTLRRSDTPRELSAKISATMEFSAIDEITSIIEQIKYAKENEDPEASNRVLGQVRLMVERHLE